MKDRYDGNPGKEARIAKVRQGRMEAEHSSKDAFVKMEQAKAAKYAGKSPNLNPASFEFDAYMSNNGRHAQILASSITAGLDKVAFPVKPAFPGDETN